MDHVHKSGAKVVLSKLPIGDVATQYFADRYYLFGGRDCYEQTLLRARFNKNSFQRGSCNDVHSRWSSEKLTWRQCLMALLSLTVLILIVIWLDGFTCLTANFNYWIIIWRMSNYTQCTDDIQICYIISVVTNQANKVYTWLLDWY